jgi:hypothetical protein
MVPDEVRGLDDPPSPVLPPLSLSLSPSSPSVAASYPPWLPLAVLTTLAATVLTLLAATHQAL